MALIATPGAANADSYLTLIEFATYLTTRPRVPAAVSTAVDATREAALIMATRMIDAMQCFTGAATTATQSLLWPRSGMLTKTGYAMASDIIPQQLKDAVSELAIALIASDIIADNQVAVLGLTELKAGPVALKFKEEIEANGLPTIVTNLLPSSWKCSDAGGPNDGTSFLFEVYNAS